MFSNAFSHQTLVLSYCCALFLLLASCSDVDDNQEGNTQPGASLDFKAKIKRQVESSLGIEATEDYTIEINNAYINPDTLEDALILVNRKEWAFKRAKKNNNEAFFNKMGHTGPFNHVFVKLGGKEKLLSSVPIGSNAKYPLEHHFEKITSEAHRDFYVDYRVRNSMHRNYYTVRDENLYLTFSCPVFDKIGEAEPKAFFIDHPESSVRVAKDIALYEGIIKDYDTSAIENVNNYTPTAILPSEELFVFFIFDQKSMKYKTPMKSDDEKDNSVK